MFQQPDECFIIIFITASKQASRVLFIISRIGNLIKKNIIFKNLKNKFVKLNKNICQLGRTVDSATLHPVKLSKSVFDSLTTGGV